ncbi:TetR/AcrR family transcriptional regulator [Paraburkholderia sp. GAS32]|uniref:TetR/AcrR family transcriptional regulator n=1 Tax=Paraburkholderia sp. GAS32 TaxID=3035129 RepID=UPI003D23032F
MNPTRSPLKPLGRRPAVEDFDVREHLLDTATRLFSECGIAATTVAQIASEAGVTSALVHYYFTNREKLLDAVADERLAPAAEFVWRPAVEDAAGDPFALVHEFVARLFDVTDRMPWLPPLWLREIVNEGGLLRERMMRRIPFDNIKRFGSRVAHAQRDGTVNANLEAMLLFNSILALVMLPLATAKIWQSARGLPVIERDALRRHVIALLIGGMQPAPHAASAPAHARARARAQQQPKPPSGRRSRKDTGTGSPS